MGLRKYKYYCRKPRSEIAKDILNVFLLMGAISVAATSPYFIANLWKGYQRWRKYPRKKFYDTFYLLYQKGYIQMREENHQIYVNLTEEGKKFAGRFQIDTLKIKKPKKWDGKWRLVIFDISELKKTHREAFRGKLKELGFQSLQKSVWIHPFDCRAEIDLLREFFGLDEEELRLVVAQDIGSAQKYKRLFKLNMRL
jgi:predicted transcriptional regulator